MVEPTLDTLIEGESGSTPAAAVTQAPVLVRQLVIAAGDEEVQYVYVTLPKDADSAQFGPGAIVRFEVGSCSCTVTAGPNRLSFAGLADSHSLRNWLLIQMGSFQRPTSSAACLKAYPNWAQAQDAHSTKYSAKRKQRRPPTCASTVLNSRLPRGALLCHMSTGP